MIRLALLRHAATAWNEERRLQGGTDLALSPGGRAAAAAWRLPGWLLRPGVRWLASPLARAGETAALLHASHPGAPAPAIEPRLSEMSFGRWEGCRLAELRAADPEGVAALEARGLDFAAPGGESPRQVQARLAPLLAELAAAGRDTLAVTHKGVIRALYARATGWPMLGRPPDRLDLGRLQVLRLAADGTPALEQLNLAIEPPPGPPP
ncbi:MAG: histidine phosphatase family protein [Dongiaceae bacterium]